MSLCPPTRSLIFSCKALLQSPRVLKKYLENIASENFYIYAEAVTFKQFFLTKFSFLYSRSYCFWMIPVFSDHCSQVGELWCPLYRCIYILIIRSHVPPVSLLITVNLVLQCWFVSHVESWRLILFISYCNLFVLSANTTESSAYRMLFNPSAFWRIPMSVFSRASLKMSSRNFA